MGSIEVPTLRWGIVGCGLISSWFVQDLMVPRASPPTKHLIRAIGSSSIDKGANFASSHCPGEKPAVYASYAGVYSDPEVDVVYIGTPHVFHLQNALDAIAAGKHVLCEKPMTMNARDTQVLVEAARKKGVYLMEGVWTRFNPLVAALQKLLHEDQVLGSLGRVFVDFALDMPFSSLPANARTADPALGAGVLLDIGIYTLTWATLILDSHPQHIAAGSPSPEMTSSMTIKNGVDETSTVILNYKDVGCQAILTSTNRFQGATEFCRIEGEKGSISIGGRAASNPAFLVVRLKGQDEKRIDFPKEGVAKGFYFEADAIAEDLRSGRKESLVIPLKESIRMMSVMDSIRKTNGLRYPQDD
ncbi:putative D-xylose 1-dehydrogenase (NADP(+)) [Lachnellula hyalina]|uniref:D-xylose 1-dehydrogenase (NADP(+), D-xylono-1,5-lactone-forming) n=1 Tax=Lachnellula hyalina TaxID=1316788 RepID=A0A8H8TZH7_9HELO|nr:putative D-xylose 1-dehydrogenase (NADP(+)) [Lachnellula hyalina]TVY27807.1 putative D-xylose 1-dehydrogenase (NADP(+)) [Lachnellula hyalina]